MARGKTGKATMQAILRVALKMFFERGYSNTSARAIAGELGISTGNITFYFPSKEHLLLSFVKLFGDAQWAILEEYIDDEQRDMLAFCLETMTVAAACEQSVIARDLFLASFRSELCRNYLREIHVERAKRIFHEYCPDWNHTQFDVAELLVMGMQEAVIAPTDAVLPLHDRVNMALNMILSVYGVPEHLRRELIRHVLSMDYQHIRGQMREMLLAWSEQQNITSPEEETA